jgi:hypothetical protein
MFEVSLAMHYRYPKPRQALPFKVGLNPWQAFVTFFDTFKSIICVILSMVRGGEKRSEILFCKGKIQGLNRVALPPELLEHLHLKEGDSIALYLNLDTDSIVLKKIREVSR